MQRKVHCRCLAFCSSKGYETKPTAHLLPTLIFLAQLIEHPLDKQKVAGSNPAEIAKKQKSVGTWNENTLSPQQRCNAEQLSSQGKAV